MALVVKNRVQETTSTTGTGTVTLSGTAPTGFQTFTNAMTDGDKTYYQITNGTDWEIGLGTYASAGNTLARTTVYESSNSNNAVNFTSGSKDVFMVFPAQQISGTIVYDTIDDLPLSNVQAGAQAFIASTNRFYLNNGTGWYNIALINTTPSISGNEESYILGTNGTATVITMASTDPEGIPITWSSVTSGLVNEATVTNVGNVFTITPSTNSANAGTFSVTFRASDGINIATASSDFTLTFTAWTLDAVTKAFLPLGYFSTRPNEFSPHGIFISSDGTKMFTCGQDNGERVYRYDLATAWDASSATLISNQGLSFPATGVFFKPDGLKMYFTTSSSDRVHEYNLSSAWDITSLSYVGFFGVGAQDTAPEDLFFKDDGTKMYVVGSSVDNVNEYDLSTPWSISTASFLQSFSVSSQEGVPNGLFFSSTGTKMYVCGEVKDGPSEYDLSTPWDVSTATYVQSKSFLSVDNSMEAIFFKSDGTRMFMIGNGNDAIYQFSLSTALDVSTATQITATQAYFSVAGQETVPTAVYLKPDGTKMYIVGTGDSVKEYSLSSAYAIETATFVQSFSVGIQEGTTEGLFFKDDGSKMYITGSTGDEVNEYALSTPWDISTASATSLFSVGSQDSDPTGLFIGNSGTKMYITGSNSDRVYEYTLSTAWDVTSASFVQFLSVSGQDTDPNDLSFKSDGTKMFLLGLTGDDVNEYDLSTPWDISTATYVQNYSVTRELAQPTGIYVLEDGSAMFLVGSTSDAVWRYNLV
jgi:sugar lactone lactonase YvrE